MTDKSVTKRAVALGYFDGLHIAHMSVLKLALEQKKNGLIPTVLLFDVPPAQVFKSVNVPRLLTDKKRDLMLSDMGLEAVYISMQQIKDMSPEAFFSKILQKQLNAGFVCCGYNYCFGKDRAGDAKKLSDMCSKNGVGCEVCKQVTLNGETVCSTAIRTAIENGDIRLAAAMLGREYGFSARVFSGDHRGRLLGAPTINQFLPSELCVPKFGVYASRVNVDGKLYAGVSNVGKRPTFGGESIRCETYILGFDGDLYNREIEVELFSFIRSEKKFDSFDALKAQIAKDVISARALLLTDGFVGE